MANDVKRPATETDASAGRRTETRLSAEARLSAEDRLAAEYLRLVELTEAKDHFLTAVSHELRTPLTSILSSTELLSVLGDLDGAPAELVGIVDRNVVRMLQLIDGLSLLARLDADQLFLDLQIVDVAELVAEAVRRHQSATGRPDLDVVLDVEAGPPASADPERLGQILDHLLTNAVKHTVTAGRLTVRAHPGDTGWTVVIQDTGIGIPAAEQATIFDEFTRGSNARRAGIPGAGLGLAISRRMAELHGGELTLTSTEGAGTTATLRLPFAWRR
jgi:signal transduction histidine kinase